MLKRQRQSSPLPHSSSSSIPLVSDGAIDLIERNTKRRRTLPPVLDGTARGWNTNSSSNNYKHGGMHRNREDEYISEEEDDWNEDQESLPFDSQYRHHQHHQSEYKSANNLLRELHTLNQHRLLFSSSSPSSTTHPHDMHASSANAMQHLQQPVTDLGRTYMTLPLDLLQPSQKFTPIEKSTDTRELSTKEVDCVTERYEHTNK